MSLMVAGCQLSTAQVGTWRAYMAYRDITDVKEGSNTLFVLASKNIYTYNENDHSIQTFDKANGLSDCSISRIEWNNTVKRLIILYDNYNIDLLDVAGNITNISEYYSKSMTENKTVYDIYMNGRYAYVSTGFGIVKIDMQNAEISDTYNLHFRVDNCYIEGSYIYASSSVNGLYRAALSSNLLDPGNWSRVGDYVAKNYTVDADLLATAQTLSPGGPRTNNFGYMKYLNGKLYTVGGGYSSTEERGRAGCIQVWDGSSWSVMDDGVASQVDHRYEDIVTIDVDPTDNSHFCVAGKTGLYEFKNNTFSTAYTPANSPLRGAASVGADSKNYNIVMGITFDTSGNLWVLNSKSATTSLLELTKGGEWVDLHNQSLISGNRSFNLMRSPFFDRDGLLWFTNDYWDVPALICYQPSTRGTNVYKSFTNEDGTNVFVSGGIRCAAEDKEGNIWCGTNVGPLYLNYADKTTSPDDVVFQQYKVPRNDGTDLADYLLTGLDITCMAIDGGNRKWFGTSGNGVYLISADNNTQVHHFLSDNSKLLSDNIESIALNPTSGEVYIGTDKGLCSYMSDASETVDKMDKDVTYAYPNPVKPGYTGPITITGLTYNADIKIVTTNGVLVNSGRSNGGTYIWDGTDLNGKRVASGVYMVQTATQTGDSGTVCKIAVVN